MDYNIDELLKIVGGTPLGEDVDLDKLRDAFGDGEFEKIMLDNDLFNKLVADIANH